MTNAEKFKEVFGVMPDEYAKDPCEMFRDFCEDKWNCSRCKLHDFWDKQYRKPKVKEGKSV